MRFAPFLVDRSSRRASMAALALATTAALAVGSGVPALGEMADLLRRSDVATNEPASFRSRILLQGPGPEAPVEIEVWHERPSRTLVRFLGAKHRGKYLLYLPEAVFFLAPGARQPVALPRSFRLHGSATLDQVLGLRYSRDFSISRAEPSEDGAHVVFELQARDAKAQYPRVRYVVERRTARPTRSELLLAGGKLATSVEFATWSPGVPLQPLRLVLRDHLRGGAATRVELLELEERNVPEGLFSLSDSAARRGLESQDPPTTR
jgi:hypothetical protein